jgi:hypothetical protein
MNDLIKQHQSLLQTRKLLKQASMAELETTRGSHAQA